MTRIEPDRETQAGGAGRAFPSTCWSRFVGGFEGEAGRAALETLAGLYWKPIHAYIRSGWSKSDEESRDLTQDFFAWMLETDFFSKADPARGRFRAFVKVALKYFLARDRRDALAQKRGGGRAILSIHAEGIPTADPVDPAGRPPEEALDEAWKDELLTRAEELLRDDLVRDGRELTFRIFHDYYLSTGTDEPEYRDLASRHSVSEGDVLVHLRHARGRFRSLLKTLVADTVESEAELEEEMRALFGAGPR